MYAILVIKLGYPPNYVLDNMEWYEIRAALEYEYLSSKENWELARMIAYIIALVNSRKKLDVTDIVKFQWEDKKEDKTIITKELIERLRKEANNFILNNNG